MFGLFNFFNGIKENDVSNSYKEKTNPILFRTTFQQCSSNCRNIEFLMLFYIFHLYNKQNQKNIQAIGLMRKLTSRIMFQIQTMKFDCQKVSNVIKNLVRAKITQLKKKPKITIILAQSSNNKVHAASEIYVKKKLEQMPEIGIQSELIRINPSITKQEMEKMITKLNQDDSNTSTMIQLPFPPQYSFNIHQLIGKIQKEKNIDGFTSLQPQQNNLLSPKSLKPPTALGIAVLLSYYGIQTKGLNVIIIGKGSLVGSPLTKMLSSHPYYATVTTCDLFTKNLKSLTKDADMVIAACGEARLIKDQDVKQKTILIDAGINQIDTQFGKSGKTIKQNQISVSRKRKIVGDVCTSAYHKSKYYTPVPGGVGLLTVSCLAFNVLNSFLLQQKLPTVDLQSQLRNYQILDQFFNKLQHKPENLRVLLISSAYNSLTQRIERVLKHKGYKIGFQAAISQEAMRSAVQSFQPSVIVCPTLMKAIPQDIYKKIKCFIVHPGIKGDRGPSSIDWAILNKTKQWGVTLIQADKQMDAGDIWASENFPMEDRISKIQAYNNSVCLIAQKLILQALKNFQNPSFKPQKLDYNNPLIYGRLHRAIKMSDAQRTISWETESTQSIMRKALAAETQPGLKVTLSLGDRKITRFSYGYVQQQCHQPRSNIKIGEIFLRKLEAVCVKTIDGAVWIKMLRPLKSRENPYPFKIPSTLHLGEEILKNIPQIQCSPLQAQNSQTFQEITFQKKGEIGILGFDFYNGAMSIHQCQRLTKSLQCLKQSKEIKVLILKGSSKNWSNGIDLNVIENSDHPRMEAMQNIKAINQVVKTIYLMNDKITISAIQANAGAGGVYLGLATDFSFAKEGIILNPHYKKMGLYGSQLHTLTAVRKFGLAILKYMKNSAQPMLTCEAQELNLLNKLQLMQNESFLDGVIRKAQQLIADKRELKRQILRINEQKSMIFRVKLLQDYQHQELKEMQMDILQDRNQFSQKRWEFVRKQQSASS